MRQPYVAAGPDVRPPTLVRWGAVFSGAVVGLALTILFESLWVALGFSSRHPLFYNHMDWWLAGTAIGTMFIAGLIAGVASGVRGTGAGFANGITTWGIVLLGVAAGAIPAFAALGSRHTFVANGIHVTVATLRPWTTFWALLIGLGAGVLGGVMGGAMPRRRLVGDVHAPATAAMTTGAPVVEGEAPAVVEGEAPATRTVRR